MSNYPRVLYQPPAGRPRWSNDNRPDGELQYLSWGWRSFGDHPVPVSCHTGWTYQLITLGRASLNVTDSPHVLQSGSLAVIGPSCPYGWSGDSTTERCRIFNWIWRDPPLFEGLCPGPEGFRILRVSREVGRRIEDLHQETRAEIRFSDEEASPSLHALRIRLDVLLSRTCGRTVRRATSKTKVKHALSWLKKHPEELRPVSALSDYLQVSPATLNRLFRSEMNQSVLKIAYAMRMEKARKLLGKSGSTVKEVAFALGYSHPNDFSRAYARFWKHSASQSMPA